MLMAVALSHLDDPENARAAYEQAVSLDPRDPSVALNFAVFLAGQGELQLVPRQLTLSPASPQETPWPRPSSCATWSSACSSCGSPTWTPTLR